MGKQILKANLAIFFSLSFGFFSLALADNSCCMVTGAGSFVLSEEDKASLKDKDSPDKQKLQESQDSKNPQKTIDKQNKEK